MFPNLAERKEAPLASLKWIILSISEAWTGGYAVRKFLLTVEFVSTPRPRRSAPEAEKQFQHENPNNRFISSWIGDYALYRVRLRETYSHIQRELEKLLDGFVLRNAVPSANCDRLLRKIDPIAPADPLGVVDFPFEFGNCPGR
jgi:hypothetical protein